MSDERLADEKADSQSPVEKSAGSAPPAAEAPLTAESAGEKLDALDDVDFLLEEIENKIAPLALA